MKFKLRHLLLFIAFIAIAFGAYVNYERIFYELVSVSEQHGKPGIWTDGLTGELLEDPIHYHISHRKRYGWLPGSDWKLGGLTKLQYEKRAKAAISYEEWDNEKTFGKAFYFVENPTDLRGDPVKVKPLENQTAR
ncbi:MAG: hypothetical protein AAGA30_13015 [Planctomycetota bacterium]